MTSIETNFKESFKIIEFNMGNAFLELCQKLGSEEAQPEQKFDFIDNFNNLVASGCEFIKSQIKVREVALPKFNQDARKFKKFAHPELNEHPELLQQIIEETCQDLKKSAAFKPSIDLEAESCDEETSFN